MPSQACGLYIHVPFCQRKCGYCDFYSRSLAAHPELKQAYLDALLRELDETVSFLGCAAARPETVARHLATVYFGGGTPSLLAAKDFQRIFDGIACHYPLDKAEEITLEANPDDLSDSYLESLRALPFNRLSIGIQSFNDGELAFIGRRHDAQTARRAVQGAQAAGFDNISIDLMFGLPHQSLDSFEASIDQALALGVQHISAYMLTLEPEVPLAKSLARGRWTACDDDLAATMYALLVYKLQAAGYEHYEISNFALPGRRSQHNSSYWNGRPYLGLGPSAHSYDGGCRRRWNAADIRSYVQGNFQREEELLRPQDMFNDYLLTRLRTSEGIDLDDLQHRFGQQTKDYCLEQARVFIGQGQLIHEKSSLRLAPEAYFVSDGIIRDLLQL